VFPEYRQHFDQESWKIFEPNGGLTKLDYFTGCALIGLLQNRVPLDGAWAAGAQAKVAINIAKAVLEELNKQQKGE
jgi:hypothetical protein